MEAGLNRLEKVEPTIGKACNAVISYRDTLLKMGRADKEDHRIAGELNVLLTTFQIDQPENALLTSQKMICKQYLFLIHTLLCHANLSIAEVATATPGNLTDIRQRLDELVSDKIVTKQFVCIDETHAIAQYSLFIPLES